MRKLEKVVPHTHMDSPCRAVCIPGLWASYSAYCRLAKSNATHSRGCRPHTLRGDDAVLLPEDLHLHHVDNLHAGVPVLVVGAQHNAGPSPSPQRLDFLTVGEKIRVPNNPRYPAPLGLPVQQRQEDRLVLTPVYS